MNGIDRAFSCGSNGGDAHIQRIQPTARTRREIPLRGTGGGAGARSDETHDAALRATGGDVVPAPVGNFNKVGSAVIHDDAGGGLGRIIERIARWIDRRAIINERRIRHP